MSVATTGRRNTFRGEPKEPLRLLLPRGLAAKLRIRAAEQRRSMSEVMSQYAARGLGECPASYGIEDR